MEGSKFAEGEGHTESVNSYHKHYGGHPFANSHVKRMYWLGRALTWGVMHAIEAMFKVFVMPFRPGCYGQARSKVGEVFRRVGLVLKGLILFLLTVWIFPIGCLLRVIATQTKKDFLFVRPKTTTAPTERGNKHSGKTRTRKEKGKEKEKRNEEEKKEKKKKRKKDKGEGHKVKRSKGKEKVKEDEDLKVSDKEGEKEKAGSESSGSVGIWTQNVGFLPFVSSFNNLLSPMERVSLLLEEIRQCDDDVICLQEQFHVGVDAHLVKKLGCGQGEWNGFHPLGDAEEDSLLSNLEEGLMGGSGKKPPFRWMISDCSSSSLGLTSGLTILSRYPLESPEFTKYTNGSGDDKWAAKGVLGCTVVLGVNPLDDRGHIKMTLFATHLNAGSNRVQHKQQMLTAVDFMNYYNRKYLQDDADLVIASVLVGDFNFSPLKYFGNGKLAEDPEWAINCETWDNNGMVNYFYGQTEEGKMRQENIETWLGFQELFYSELQSAGRSKEGGDIRMDADGLLKAIKKLLVRKIINEEKKQEKEEGENKKGKQSGKKEKFDWDEEVETLIKGEINRMLEHKFGESTFRTSRIKSMGEYLARLHLIEKDHKDSSQDIQRSEEHKRRYERLLPGTSINTKATPIGSFPNAIDHDDLDHILVQSRIHTLHGDVEGRVEDASFSLVQNAVTFTDHLGKRAKLRFSL